MKRIIIIATLLVSTTSFASAAMRNILDGDKHISFSELPVKSQNFITTHFPNSEVAYVTMDRDLYSTDYDVMLSCGTKIEFNADGDWTEVDCQRMAVSDKIVPQELQAYVEKNYPTQEIRDIQRDKRGWDIKLSSGLELEFNNSYRLVEVDD